MSDARSRLRPLAEARFRASPNYRLTTVDTLDSEKRETLGIGAENRDVAALLVAKDPNSPTIKAIDAETAALFRALRKPGRLPARLLSTTDPAISRAIARLVLDGLIEVERRGAFVSGAAAQAAIFEDTVARSAQGRLSHLSLEAIRYVQSLGIDEVGKLASRLYFYNRLPVTGRWLALWPDASAVLQYVGLDEGRLFADGFERVTGGRAAWIVWKARDPALGLQRHQVAFKLYVSPMPGGERTAFAAMLDVARSDACAAFKIGADAYGLLRPDKMILYFLDREALDRAVSMMARKLDGCRAIGVPFSAELTRGGLLSWGIDPPRADALGLEQGAESWRLGVVNRLAHALLQHGHEASQAEDALTFALARLELEGIDTRTWTPVGPGESAALH